MRILAGGRQVYDRLVGARRRALISMRKEPFSEKADQFYRREQQIAVQRDCQDAGRTWIVLRCEWSAFIPGPV